MRNVPAESSPRGGDAGAAAYAASQYNPVMDTPVLWRFRSMALLLVAAIWSAATSHPHVHSERFWIALALALVWAAAVLGRGFPPWRAVRTAIGFGASVAATLTDPAFGALLLISVGWLGTRMPWRYLWVYGAGVAVFGAAVLAARAGPPFPRFILSPGFLNLAMWFGLVLLFGRLIADNAEIRAAQARSLEELQAAHAELQRRASAMEEVAMLRERSRLSRELHDTLGHALSAITVQLEAIRRLLPTDAGRAERMLGETQEAARAAMGDLRLHLSALRDPPAPPDLAGALRRLCAEAADRNGWGTALELEPVELGAAQRRAMLQMAREALENCERHAHAGTLRVRLGCDQGRVSLAIQDDGDGFDPEAVAPDRFGLQGMRERMRALTGELRVESSPGGGTRIVGVVPAAGPAVEGV